MKRAGLDPASFRWPTTKQSEKNELLCAGMKWNGVCKKFSH